MHAHDMPQNDGENKTPIGKPTPDPWYKRYAREYYEGTRELSLEERGAYSDILDLIYMAGGPLKDDDRLIAHKLCIHVNKWTKLRRRLLSVGKLFIVRGYLHNAKAKRVLAGRAAERAAMGQRGVTPGQPGGGARGVTQGDFFENPNEINGRLRGTSTELESQREEVEGDNIIPLRASQERAGLNGAIDPMLRDVIAWMHGGDDKSAREWVGTQTAIYSERIVRDSYSKLKADIASGKIISRPLQTWCAIAGRMHAAPQNRQTDQQVDQLMALAKRMGGGSQ